MVQMKNRWHEGKHIDLRFLSQMYFLTMVRGESYFFLQLDAMQINLKRGMDENFIFFVESYIKKLSKIVQKNRSPLFQG